MNSINTRTLNVLIQGLLDVLRRKTEMTNVNAGIIL